jgi:hypothetical protein
MGENHKIFLRQFWKGVRDLFGHGPRFNRRFVRLKRPFTLRTLEIDVLVDFRPGMPDLGMIKELRAAIEDERTVGTTYPYKFTDRDHMLLLRLRK